MDKLLIRKDIYDELLEKGYGNKDLSKLTKKQITDKNGHRRTVYVRNGEDPSAQKQPKSQEELTSEKKAHYEEMLEKVKAGSDENALFVRGKGMLNKKDAIAHLSEKLGKKPVNSAYVGHLESDYPPNTDITKEDEERFGKQALSGLSGKRIGSGSTNVAQKMADAEDKAFYESEKNTQKKYGNMSVEELKTEMKKYEGARKYTPEYNELIEINEVLNQKLAEGKNNGKTDSNNETISYEQAETAMKEGKSVQWQDRNGNWNNVEPGTSELVMARDIGSKLRINPENKTKLSKDDMIENYLDAKNEGGKDIADENRIDEHSKKAIKLNKDDKQNLERFFSALSSNTQDVINELSKEEPELYTKLVKMESDYKSKNPKANGKTFDFDLTKKFLEDSFNEYKKDNPVGGNKYKSMTGKEIVEKYREDLPIGRYTNTKEDLLHNIDSEINFQEYLKRVGSTAFNENRYNFLNASKNNFDEIASKLKLK